MPTYDYRCDACGHAFEEFQSMTAAPLKKCPACGKSKLQRLIGTGAGIIFKGGGFYETDYRSESYKKAAEAEKSGGKPAEKADASAPSTADKKPESGGGEKKTGSPTPADGGASTTSSASLHSKPTGGGKESAPVSASKSARKPARKKQ